jgi:hypothetical protein
VGAELFHLDGQTGGQKDTTKLKEAFRKFYLHAQKLVWMNYYLRVRGDAIG